MPRSFGAVEAYTLQGGRTSCSKPHSSKVSVAAVQVFQTPAASLDPTAKQLMDPQQPSMMASGAGLRAGGQRKPTREPGREASWSWVWRGHVHASPRHRMSSESQPNAPLRERKRLHNAELRAWHEKSSRTSTSIRSSSAWTHELTWIRPSPKSKVLNPRRPRALKLSKT